MIVRITQKTKTEEKLPKNEKIEIFTMLRRQPGDVMKVVKMVV